MEVLYIIFNIFQPLSTEVGLWQHEVRCSSLLDRVEITWHKSSEWHMQVSYEAAVAQWKLFKHVRNHVLWTYQENQNFISERFVT